MEGRHILNFFFQSWLVVHALWLLASLARTVPEPFPTNPLFVLWLVLHVFDRVGWDGMLSWQDGGRFSKLVNLGVYQF